MKSYGKKLIQCGFSSSKLLSVSFVQPCFEMAEADAGFSIIQTGPAGQLQRRCIFKLNLIKWTTPRHSENSANSKTGNHKLLRRSGLL